MPSESVRLHESGRSSGQLLAQGWKGRYTAAIVILALGMAAAIWFPSSDATPPSHTLRFICLFEQECPPLNHHVLLRLLIGFGGLCIALAIAFLPRRRPRMEALT